MKADNVSGEDEESSIIKDRLSVLVSHLFLSPSPLSVSPPAADHLLLHRRPLMASEKQAALSATPPSDHHSPTIFDKIINKEIPVKIVFEDDKVLAFRDIAPQAPTHILIIPKVKDGLTGLSQAEEKHCEILGRLMYTAKLVAKQEGLDDGYRVVINDGPSACQSVYHIHVHLLGGAK